jgi:hypothetical protein
LGIDCIITPIDDEVHEVEHLLRGPSELGHPALDPNELNLRAANEFVTRVKSSSRGGGGGGIVIHNLSYGLRALIGAAAGSVEVNGGRSDESR